MLADTYMKMHVRLWCWFLYRDSHDLTWCKGCRWSNFHCHLEFYFYWEASMWTSPRIKHLGRSIPLTFSSKVAIQRGQSGENNGGSWPCLACSATGHPLSFRVGCHYCYHCCIFSCEKRISYNTRLRKSLAKPPTGGLLQVLWSSSSNSCLIFSTDFRTRNWWNTSGF